MTYGWTQIGWLEVGLALSLLLLYFYYSWTSAYSYWKRRNVPFLTPKFPFGHAKDVLLLKKNFRDFWLGIYKEMGDRPFCGIYLVKTPILVVKEPELIKKVVATNFSYFTDHGWSAKEFAHEPLLNNMFNMEGEQWKYMRNKLSPAFSSGKMRMMFPIMHDCAQQMKTALDNVAKDTGTFEAKDLTSRFAVDIIVNCAFGLNSTSVLDPECHFYKTGQKMLERSFKRKIANIMVMQSPQLYSLLRLHFLHYESAQYFADMIKNNMEYREKNNVCRNDFVDILVRLKNNLSIDDEDMFSLSQTTLERRAKAKYNLPVKSSDSDIMNDLLSQALVFFFAGFETVAANIAFSLYELSKYPHLQVKVQEEVDAALKRHGGFTYQMLQELPYIDRVLDETLRLYGALSTLDRLCVKSFKIPDTNVVIEKGCKLVIPLYGIHHDPQYYPDPEKFDPDRFLEENVKSRPDCTYMPFGEGPRLCIGIRFSRMEMRLALSIFFSEFGCKLHPGTPNALRMACGEIFTTTKDPINLDLIHRNPNERVYA